MLAPEWVGRVQSGEGPKRTQRRRKRDAVSVPNCGAGASPLSSCPLPGFTPWAPAVRPQARVGYLPALLSWVSSSRGQMVAPLSSRLRAIPHANSQSPSLRIDRWTMERQAHGGTCTHIQLIALDLLLPFLWRTPGPQGCITVHGERRKGPRPGHGKGSPTERHCWRPCGKPRAPPTHLRVGSLQRSTAQAVSAHRAFSSGPQSTRPGRDAPSQTPVLTVGEGQAGRGRAPGAGWHVTPAEYTESLCRRPPKSDLLLKLRGMLSSEGHMTMFSRHRSISGTLVMECGHQRTWQKCWAVIKKKKRAVGSSDGSCFRLLNRC